MYEMQSYAEWESYLAGGRKKYERTLYDRGLRIQHQNKFKKGGDIEIVIPWLQRYPIITIHPDDSMTIQSQPTQTYYGTTYNPLSAYSTRFTIWKYAGLEIVQRNYKFHIYEYDAAITPPKIQGCRHCRQSGKMDGWCNSPSCWNGDIVDGKFVCPDHPGAVQNNMYTRWHSLPCEHGILNQRGHTVKQSQKCWSCNGTGKRDYGSKRISLPWDGSPLKVKDRKIVVQHQTDLERIVASYVRT